MRLAYAGTAPFAALVLDRLASTSHTVVTALTAPDKPRGRHGTPQPSAAKVAAARLGIPVLQPERLDEATVREALLAPEPEAFVVCAYGRIVPRQLFEALPTLVVHPSLVPRWRGAAPVERALMAGETELGVTVLLMSEGVDEGPVGAARARHVDRDADAGQAYEALAGPACDALLEVLDGLAVGTIVWREQQGEPTYAAKLGEEDRLIDWRRPAAAIADQVRALAPRIGAIAELGGRRVLIWKARPLPAMLVLADGERRHRLVLATGEGALEVLELQEAGKRRITAAEYLRGAGRRLTQQ